MFLIKHDWWWRSIAHGKNATNTIENIGGQPFLCLKAVQIALLIKSHEKNSA